MTTEVRRLGPEGSVLRSLEDETLRCTRPRWTAVTGSRGGLCLQCIDCGSDRVSVRMPLFWFKLQPTRCNLGKDEALQSFSLVSLIFLLFVHFTATPCHVSPAIRGLLTPSTDARRMLHHLEMKEWGSTSSDKGGTRSTQVSLALMFVCDLSIIANPNTTQDDMIEI